MKLKDRSVLNRMKVKWNKRKLNKVQPTDKRKVTDHVILLVCYVMFTFSVRCSGCESYLPVLELEFRNCF